MRASFNFERCFNHEIKRT
jgi:class 3 adenylate cyclase